MSGFDNDFAQEKRKSGLQRCNLEHLVSKIDDAEPGWAVDFWHAFHGGAEQYAGAALQRTINRALARLDLLPEDPEHPNYDPSLNLMKRETLNRCRRGDCAQNGHSQDAKDAGLRAVQ